MAVDEVTESSENVAQHGNTSDKYPFLHSANPNIVKIIVAVLDGDQSEETKNGFVREQLPEYYPKYLEWKQERRKSHFLADIPEYVRKLCEGLISKGDLDQLEKELYTQKRSQSQMEAFGDWRKNLLHVKKSTSTSQLTDYANSVKSRERKPDCNVRGLNEMVISSTVKRPYNSIAGELRNFKSSLSTGSRAIDAHALPTPPYQTYNSECTISNAQRNNKENGSSSAANAQTSSTGLYPNLDQECDRLSSQTKNKKNVFPPAATAYTSGLYPDLNQERGISSPQTKIEQNGSSSRSNQQLETEPQIENGAGSHGKSINRDDTKDPINQELETEQIIGPAAKSHGKLLNKNDEKDPSEYMNILVLGETGVGKSTFINGIVNYLKYQSMEDALNGGVECLIDTSFTLSDNDAKIHKIACRATVPENGYESNESSDVGQSATQFPKSYNMSFGKAGSETRVRIIDTPGVGDTRGTDQDDYNFKNVLSFISQYSKLHAVCILIKPNDARLNVTFRYCIDQLLGHLHKSASRNILFCFTNTRGTLYKPGDTLTPLTEHLDKLKTREIIIPIDKSTIFCFENECFRFLCAKQNGFPFTETEKNNFKRSWEQSKRETMRLFHRVDKLPVHTMQDTTSLNNCRSTINFLIGPLCREVQNQMINEQVYLDTIEQMKTYSQANETLEKRIYVYQMMTNLHRLNEPETVCTDGKCAKFESINGNPKRLQTVYKICHPKCHLEEVTLDLCPNVALKNCWAMDKSSSPKCRICGCGWDKHMHTYHGTKPEMLKVVDPNIRNRIERNEDATRTIQMFSDDLERQIEQKKRERDVVIGCLAEFTVFLTQNSFVSYNNVYTHITFLIEEENDKIQHGGDSRLIRELEKLKRHYNSKVQQLLEKIKENANCVKSTAQIDDMLTSLSKLKCCQAELIQNICLENRTSPAVESN